MGQAKQRGTYEQRVQQALTANAALRQKVETMSHLSLRDKLTKLMDKNGVQKFRMSIGQHYNPNEEKLVGI